MKSVPTRFLVFITSLLILPAVMAGCAGSAPKAFDALFTGGTQETPLQLKLESQGSLSVYDSLKESSGFARLDASLFSGLDDRGGKILVTHNDSFGTNSLYAVSFNSNQAYPFFEASLGKRGKNFDWEDAAPLGPGRLVVADCGDNLKIRRFMDLYFVDFRPVAAGYKQGVSTEPLVRKVKSRYPGLPADQKNYDCESLFTRGDSLYFLTKERGGSRMFEMKLTNSQKQFAYGENPGIAPKPIEMTELKSAGTLKSRYLITSTDYHEERRELAVLSYGELTLYADSSAASEALHCSALKPAARISLGGGQWEAVSYLDEKRVLVSAESGLYRIYSIEQ